MKKSLEQERAIEIEKYNKDFVEENKYGKTKNIFI